MTAKNWATSLLVVLGVAGPLTISADTGSGSGRALTPYKAGEKIDEARVKAVRARANALAAVEGVRVKGTNVSRTGYKIGFVCADGTTITGSPRPSFKGKDANGAATEIEFADIDTFAVTAVTASSASVEIAQFPALSPKQLLELQPTYAQLRKDWRRTVTLNVPLVCNGGELALAGTEWDTKKTYTVLFGLGDLPAGAPVKMRSSGGRGEHVWWAIPSVAAGKDYPHRRVTKK